MYIVSLYFTISDPKNRTYREHQDAEYWQIPVFYNFQRVPFDSYTVVYPGLNVG